MSEGDDRPVKEIIDERKAKLEKDGASSLFKKKESSEDSEKSKDPSSPLDELTTEEIFDYLIARVKDERSSIIIEKAKVEYEELSERITEAKARRAVGEVLREVIQSKLLAAQAVSRIPTNQ